MVNYHHAATFGHLARELSAAVLLSKVGLLIHFVIVHRALITHLSEVGVIYNVLVYGILLVGIFIVAFVCNCGGIRRLFKKSCHGYSLLRLQLYGGLSIKLLVGLLHAII